MPVQASEDEDRPRRRSECGQQVDPEDDREEDQVLHTATLRRSDEHREDRRLHRRTSEADSDHMTSANIVSDSASKVSSPAADEAASPVGRLSRSMPRTIANSTLARATMNARR